MDEEIWLTNLELKWPHRYPADRTIDAAALVRDAVLLSKDQIIREFYQKTVW